MGENSERQAFSFSWRQLLLWPLYLPTLLTTAKSFKKNPVIGNRLLNRLGLHVLRVTLAAAIMPVRRLPLMWMLSREDRQALHRDGYLVKTGFLPEDLFTRLAREVLNTKPSARICIQGDAITHRVLLDADTQSSLPACSAGLSYKPFRRILGYTSGRFRVPGVWIQRIYSKVHPELRDPQLDLHSDTFHPSVKAWLFLHDVDAARGPFTFIPGSHRLNWRRIKWEYQRSLRVTQSGDHYSASGSFRLEPGDREQLGLPEPLTFVVPANTLVIADTHGFHCRGEVPEPCERLAIWAISRTNPFNPLPGLPFPFLSRFDLWLFKQNLLWHDRRARRRGGQPSWRKVNQDWRPIAAPDNESEPERVVT